MKLLVTGGAGFIGSNFIRYWMQEHPDDSIINLDLLTYAGVRASVENLESDPRYTFVHGDIRDVNVVDGVMAGIDIVVHFAAETHVDRSVLGPVVFSHTNVLGTHVLLESALKHDVQRFHHVSTDEVFGSLAFGEKELFHESRRFAPNSPYAASKAGSDHLVSSYYKTFGLPTTISNTSNNIGPYQYPEKVVPLYITNAIDDKPLPVYGDGTSLREYLHVHDHCIAIDLIICQGTPGETYCVGGMAEKNTVEVAEAILDALGKPHDLIQFVADRPGHDRRYAIDSTKIKEQLGWEPSFTFEMMIKSIVQWYIENDSWWRELRNQESFRAYYDAQYGSKLKI